MFYCCSEALGLGEDVKAESLSGRAKTSYDNRLSCRDTQEESDEEYKSAFKCVF